MDSGEKDLWTISLWALSIVYVFMAGFAWGSGLWSLNDTALPIIQFLFWGLFVSWILRITYLAGRKSKR